jgi:hypothetical protein
MVIPSWWRINKGAPQAVGERWLCASEAFISSG